MVTRTRKSHAKTRVSILHFLKWKNKKESCVFDLAFSNCCRRQVLELWAGVRSEGGNALAERPAQDTGETPHGSFCLPESHCEESQEQGFKLPSVVVHFTELVKQVHDHAHVNCSPTQLPRSVVLGAVQGLWRRCYRMPAIMCVPATVA